MSTTEPRSSRTLWPLVGLILASAVSACGSSTAASGPGQKDGGATTGSTGTTIATPTSSSGPTTTTSTSASPTTSSSRTSSSATSSAATPDAGGHDAGGQDASLHDAASPEADAPPGAPTLLAVPLSACGDLSYQGTVTIGGSQQFQMSIDTGSTTMAVAASACTNCGVTPEYTPGPGATDTMQPVTAGYGAGNFGWDGTIYLDGVSLGAEPATPLDFAAITTQMMFFEGAVCKNAPMPGQQGILGLAPAASAATGTQGYFDQFLVTYPNVPNVFATELCPTEGTLWLGGYDATHTTAAPQYTPLFADGETAGYYTVALTSIQVEGTTIPVASATYPTSFVDTGTTALILLTPTFNSLVQALSANAAVQQILGAGSGDAGANAMTFFTSAAGGSLGECLTLAQSAADLDAMLPPMTLVFGSSPAISVQAAATESYLFQYGTQWCSTLESLAPGDLGPLAATVGAAVLRSSVVIFDRGNQRMGFAPHTACP